MAISISLVLLLTILAVIFLRNGLKASHALVCALLGFLIASTSMAPTIHDGIGATADLVSGLHP
jgi:signal peptidase I